MEDKTYFMPGDLVILSKELPNAPVMLVLKKETSFLRLKDDNEGILRGIRCRWFTNDGYMQEAVFNTKDLKKLN